LALTPALDETERSQGRRGGRLCPMNEKIREARAIKDDERRRLRTCPSYEPRLTVVQPEPEPEP